jgi:hypothetical protein
MQIAVLCAAWKIGSGAEYLVLKALKYQNFGVRRKLPGGSGISHYDLMWALWRVSSMLTLSFSLLNREWTLRNVLKVFASIIYLCNLHAVFQSVITRRYFTWFINDGTNVSWAKRAIWHLDFGGIVYIQIVQVWGQDGNLWHCISVDLDVSPSNETLNFLFERNELIIVIKLV